MDHQEGPSGIISDHVGSSGLIWAHPGSSGIIWDYLASEALAALGSPGSPEKSLGDLWEVSGKSLGRFGSSDSSSPSRVPERSLGSL